MIRTVEDAAFYTFLRSRVESATSSDLVAASATERITPSLLTPGDCKARDYISL